MRATNGHLAVAHGGPDELPFLKAFGEEAQSIRICPENFDGITPAATEDEQVAGEGVLIQYVLYLLAQTVEGFTHVGGAGDQPDTGARREGDHRPLPVSSRSSVFRIAGDKFPVRRRLALPTATSQVITSP